MAKRCARLDEGVFFERLSVFNGFGSGRCDKLDSGSDQGTQSERDFAQLVHVVRRHHERHHVDDTAKVAA